MEGAIPVQSSKVNAKTEGNSGKLVAVIIVLVCLAVAAILVWLAMNPTKDEKKEPLQPPITFCCPAEALRLARTVNRSLDPCNGFHDYVCSGVIEFPEPRYARTVDSFRTDILEGVGRVHLPAGQVLGFFYSSCAENKGRVLPFMTQTAAELIELLAVSATMARSAVGHFLLVTNTKFDFKNVVAYKDPFYDSPLAPDPYALIRLNNSCDGCLTEVLGAINGAFKTQVTVVDVLSFESSKMPNISAMQALQSADDLENMFEVPKEAVIEATKDVERNMMNVSAMFAPSAAEMKQLLDVLSDPTLQPASIAYMVARVAVAAAQKLTNQRVITDSYFPDQATAICRMKLKALQSLWRQLYIEDLTNATIEAAVRQMYQRVLESVAKTAAAGYMFFGDDNDRINPTLRNLTLVLLSDFAVDVPLPNMTATDYGRNYIRAISYESLAHRLKAQRKFPVLAPTFSVETMLMYDDYVVVHPTYYILSNFLTSKHQLINMPVLGLGMAQAMWSRLLNSSDWSNRTSSNIQRFYDCFKEHFFGDRPMAAAEAVTVQYAAALSSITKLAVKEDWGQVTQATSSWSFSYGQFFYMHLADSICPITNSTDIANRINTMLRYSPEFADAFHCSAASRMAQRSNCSSSPR